MGILGDLWRLPYWLSCTEEGSPDDFRLTTADSMPLWLAHARRLLICVVQISFIFSLIRFWMMQSSIRRRLGALAEATVNTSETLSNVRADLNTPLNNVEFLAELVAASSYLHKVGRWINFQCRRRFCLISCDESDTTVGWVAGDLDIVADECAQQQKDQHDEQLKAYQTGTAIKWWNFSNSQRFNENFHLGPN